jgi:hypothetical protein
LRFFGQILHLQWPAQTSKTKKGLGPLGVKVVFLKLGVSHFHE